jgi:hypothetical protein
MNKLVILIIVLAILAFVLPLTKSIKVPNETNQKSQPVLSVTK